MNLRSQRLLKCSSGKRTGRGRREAARWFISPEAVVRVQHRVGAKARDKAVVQRVSPQDVIHAQAHAVEIVRLTES
ncbi:MAG TPA: hypothetical protein PKY64_01490 [Anaerolineaceae bacterium]|nr:hypothetical protein [Anaerolineaceae bacterium]